MSLPAWRCNHPRVDSNMRVAKRFGKPNGTVCRICAAARRRAQYERNRDNEIAYSKDYRINIRPLKTGDRQCKSTS